MAVRVADKADIVVRCVPREDGGYLVITHKSGSGSSRVELAEGTRIVIRDGLAVRPSK